MLKFFLTFTALVAFATGSSNAQQREATFQKIVVPDASFDIVLAMAKPGSSIEDYREELDPTIIYLGNNLVTAYTAELSEMMDLEALLHPASSFVPGSGDKTERAPVFVYFVPKRATHTPAAMR